MNPRDSAYFAYDKEQLLKALARFDGDLKEEDVLGPANAKQYHTVLLQILLEEICGSYVQNEQQKEVLLKEMCNRLSNLKICNPSLILDKSNPVRIEIKQKFFNFVREAMNDVIPGAEVDSKAVSFLESKTISADPDLCFKKCFEEIERIGHGGFGVVFKAKNKLTQHIYAVKKIPFNYKNDSQYLKVIREAKSIAALDHPNVVRYNNAWIEVVASDADQCNINNESLDYDECDNSKEEDESFSENGASAILITEDDSSLSGTMEKVTASKSSNTEVPNWNFSESSDSVIFSDSAEVSKDIGLTFESCHENSSDGSQDEKSSSDSSDTKGDLDMPFRLNLNVRGTLYIQMEYCDTDLRRWLNKRAEGSTLPFDMDVNEIFSNIVSGLAHIHSKEIIHRDLKPQNIFYSKASKVLKIGDFGLATLSDSTINYLNGDRISNFHSANLGTLPYAAPEQIASKSYDFKVDIYSVGIILIELMNTFSTGMEFSRAISDVKSGKVTEEMKKLPHLVSIVRNLINENPEERMSAEKLLSYIEEDTKVQLKKTENALKEKKLELKKVTEELQKMTELLMKKKEEIHQKDERIKKIQALLNN